MRDKNPILFFFIDMQIFPQSLQVLEDAPAVDAKDKLVSDDIRYDMVDKILADLQKAGGVEACAAASRDGLLIRAIMQNEQHAESLAAMSATMLGAAEAAAAGLGKGVPDRIIVESELGRLIAVGAGPKTLLIALANSDTGLGLILLELERSAENLKELLK